MGRRKIARKIMASKKESKGYNGLIIRVVGLSLLALLIMRTGVFQLFISDMEVSSIFKNISTIIKNIPFWSLFDDFESANLISLLYSISFLFALLGCLGAFLFKRWSVELLSLYAIMEIVITIAFIEHPAVLILRPPRATFAFFNDQGLFIGLFILFFFNSISVKSQLE